MKIFNVLFVTVLLLLSGCSIFSRPTIEDNRPPPVITTHITQLAYECPEPPQVDNFDARDIVWDVASRQELDGVMIELLEELGYIEDEDIFIINQVVGDFFFHPDDEVRWSLSADDYAKLGRNTSDILAAAKQLKTIVGHYRQCVQDSKDALIRANEATNTEVSE